MAKEYDVEFESMIVDNASMQLVGIPLTLMFNSREIRIEIAYWETSRVPSSNRAACVSTYIFAPENIYVLLSFRSNILFLYFPFHSFQPFPIPFPSRSPCKNIPQAGLI